tara:strand:- start:599 stop:2233 length:1635 start_codon:yes stop_codon:yes gene_type:complete
MKIPHNFAVNPVAAPRVRKVNDRTLQADAIMAQADQQLTATVGKAVGTANEIYQGHIQKQYDSDMIAGGAMLDQLKAKRDGEISNIPVGQGIDRAGEVKKINDRYNSEWTGWSGKNIRNQGHRRVASDMQLATDAFANDGATYSARQGVVYDQAVNVSNINMSSGVYAAQLKANPEDAAALSNLKRDQDALFASGAQDEATTVANKAAIGIKALEMQDANKVLRAEVLSSEGKFDEASEVLDGLSSQFTKDEVTVLKTETLSKGAFSAYKLIGQNTDSGAAWKELGQQIAENKHLDAKHKIVLMSQVESGMDKIDKGQKAIDRKYSSESRRGLFDIEQYREDMLNDTEDGLSTVGSAAMEDAYIQNASLYNSKAQISSDRSIYSQASKVIGDVTKYSEKVAKWQMDGKMTQDDLLKELKVVKKKGKDRDWSEPVVRQAERELMLAYDSSLGGSPMVTASWRKWDEEMPEPVAKVYGTVNQEFLAQDKTLGNFVDFSDSSERIRNGLKEWIDTNPNPTPSEIQEQSKKWKDYIFEKTTIEARRRL